MNNMMRTVMGLMMMLLPYVALASDYTITDLGGLVTNGVSDASGVNNSGVVVGRAYTTTSGSAPYHAVVWSGGIISDLGTLGGALSWSNAINSAGTVAGFAQYTYSGTDYQHPFTYSGSTMTDLRIVNYVSGYVNGLNDAGNAVGCAGTATYTRRPFIWNGGVPTDLATAYGLNSSAIPYGINSSGQIVGNSSADSFLLSGGVLYTIGSFGAGGTAYAINPQGQIAGGSWFAAGYLRAYRWTPDIPNATTGILKNLGLISGTSGNSTSLAINAWGVTVGQSATSSGADHAFIYRCCSMEDLNDLIPSGSGWILTKATGINDKGQIVGSGINSSGVRRAFLLTPN